MKPAPSPSEGRGTASPFVGLALSQLANECHSTTHTPKVYNTIGSVGGWQNGNAVYWANYLPSTNSQQGGANAVAGGSATISANFTGTDYTPNCQPPPCHSPCLTHPLGAGNHCTANVDTLVFTITSGAAPNDSQGVVCGQRFSLKIQAKSPAGVVPDTAFHTGGESFQLLNKNSSVGESAPSTVSFSSGTANANGVVAVQASGLTNSTRTIVVSANATGTVFFFQVYMNVFATDEGLVNATTACGYKIPQNAQMFALPYGKSLCGQQVLVENGAAQQTVPVEDVGPWCPNTPGPGNSNTCSCSSDPYWLGSGVPEAVTLEGSCNSNGAGIDLGDGTYSTVRGGTNGAVDWKFP